MLGHHWEPAEGTVIDIRKTRGPLGGSPSSHEFLIEIRSSGSQPLRIELGTPGVFDDFVPPSVGQLVKIEVDKARQDARFVSSDPAASAATVLATGVPIRVVVVDAALMSRKTAAGLDIFALVLSIQADGLPDRQAVVSNPVPSSCRALLGPGSNLPARMLSHDPDAIVIDWEAALQLAGAR